MSHIEVHGPTGASSKLWAIVDSGADYLQFPATFAGPLGISTSGPGATSTSVKGATGSSTMTLVSGIDVTIEGVRITVSVLLGAAAHTPLLGRTAILKAIEFGLEKNGWIYL